MRLIDDEIICVGAFVQAGAATLFLIDSRSSSWVHYELFLEKHLTMN